MSDQLLRDAAAVLQPGFVDAAPGRAPGWVLRAVAEDGLGGVAYYGRNIGQELSQTAALSAQLKAENPDLLIAVDEEGGDVTRLHVATGSAYPGNLALGYVDDVALSESVAFELGGLLRAAGITLNYAPDADVNTNHDNPVVGTRSFGADPENVARHTAAYVRGMQRAGVAACAKHFPGHGDTSVDSHHGLPRVDHSAEGWEAHLAPFRAAVAADVKSVMTAHILAPFYDDESPSTMSRRVLIDLLRGELGFTGLIITDGIEMGAIADVYGVAEGTVLALAAGCDAICVGGGLRDEADYLMLRDAVVAAVKAGRLPEARLADAAARVRALGAWTRQRLAVDAIPSQGADTALLGLAGRAALDAVDGADGSAGAGEPVGLTAARRAIEVFGAPPVPLTVPAVVLEFSPVANNAAGAAVPWGLSAVLDELPAGSTCVRFAQPGWASAFSGDHSELRPAYEAVPYTPAAVSDAVAAASDRPLIMVVRDLHRHAWMASAAEAVAAARPDVTVVEMGVPYGVDEKSVGATLIATHGAARVSGLAAAEALTGRAVGSGGAAPAR